MAKLEIPINIDWNDIRKALEERDIVEVVRCKDCEYYTQEDRWCRRLGLCGAFDGNGFCSFGERRE